MSKIAIAVLVMIVLLIAFLVWSIPNIEKALYQLNQLSH